MEPEPPFGKGVLKSRYPLVLLEKIRRSPHRFYVLTGWLLQRTINKSIGNYDASLTARSSIAVASSSTVTGISGRPRTSAGEFWASSQSAHSTPIWNDYSPIRVYVWSRSSHRVCGRK